MALERLCEILHSLPSSKADSSKLDVPSLHDWGRALLDLKFILSLQYSLGVIKANLHSELQQQQHGQ